MPKTLTEIESINQDMLTPAMVAGYLGVSPQAIRVQAVFSFEMFTSVCLVLHIGNMH